MVGAAGERSGATADRIFPNMETAIKQSHQQQASFRTGIFVAIQERGLSVARTLSLTHTHARTDSVGQWSHFIRTEEAHRGKTKSTEETISS